MAASAPVLVYATTEIISMRHAIVRLETTLVEGYERRILSIEEDLRQIQGNRFTAMDGEQLESHLTRELELLREDVRSYMNQKDNR